MRCIIKAAHRFESTAEGESVVRRKSFLRRQVSPKPLLLRLPCLSISDRASSAQSSAMLTRRGLDLFIFGWKFLASLLTRIYGYLPGREWKMGSDQETRLSHAHSREWVISKNWIDPVDGFNYRQAIRKITLPPDSFGSGRPRL